MPLRVIIEAVGEDLRLVHKSHADMVLPAAPTAAGDEGIVAELRNDRDETLFRQDVSSQVEPGIEVFSPEQIQRVDVPERRRTVMLVLPDHAEARSLVFLRTARRAGPGLRQATTSTREIARISLTEDEE